MYKPPGASCSSVFSVKCSIFKYCLLNKQIEFNSKVPQVAQVAQAAQVPQAPQVFAPVLDSLWDLVIGCQVMFTFGCYGVPLLELHVCSKP